MLSLYLYSSENNSLNLITPPWKGYLFIYLFILLPRRYSPIGPRPPLMRFLNLTLIDNW
jgi:hypothetical protein